MISAYFNFNKTSCRFILNEAAFIFIGKAPHLCGAFPPFIVWN
jgi:hypothetical protein